MKITSDWHIHSRNSCDSASMTVRDIIAGAAERGIRHYGLTDHVHTPFNLPDLAASRKEFDAANGPAEFHFGVEASCVSQWEIDEIATGRYDNPVFGLREGGPAGADLAIAITREDIDAYDIEYVIGGVHWPMYVPIEREAVIRDYHRQYMFLAGHPLVDIVAHPWWWQGYWEDADGCFRGDPWFDDFGKIPASMHAELAAALVAGGKALEINLHAMILNRRYTEHFKRQYLAYLADMHSRGVALALGSDCHSPTYEPDFETAAEMLQSIGIRDEELWLLPPRSG